MRFATRTISLVVSAASLEAHTGGPASPPFAVAHAVPLRGIEPGGDRADLAPLRAIVGDARVVALGQPALGRHEPLAFRNRLIEYLVEDLGFTAIAVESAFPGSRHLADYIAGGPGTAEEVVGEARTWWHGPLEENLQLVRWSGDAGGPWDTYERMPTGMGQPLRAALGDRLVVIGMREATPSDGRAAVPRPFLLNPRPAGAGGTRPAAPGAAFDSILVVDSLTPARPARPPH